MYTVQKLVNRKWRNASKVYFLESGMKLSNYLVNNLQYPSARVIDANKTVAYKINGRNSHDRGQGAGEEG